MRLSPAMQLVRAVVDVALIASDKNCWRLERFPGQQSRLKWLARIQPHFRVNCGRRDVAGFVNAGLANGPFPLTPAHSLGERETSPCIRDRFQRYLDASGELNSCVPSLLA